MKKKRRIQAFLTAMVCLLVMFPSVLVYGYSKSYTGNFEFSSFVWLKGNKSIFNDNTFKCNSGKFKITTRISKQTDKAQASSEVFYVKVYRIDLKGDNYIGRGMLKRSGTSSASWKNMKHARYRFELVKDEDGCELKGSVTLDY